MKVERRFGGTAVKLSEKILAPVDPSWTLALIASRRQGAALRTVAREFDVCHQTVSNIANRWGGWYDRSAP